MRIKDFYHADHGITSTVVLEALHTADPDQGFFIVEARPGGSYRCGLYGPSMGDPIVREKDVFYQKRSPDRPDSRMVMWPHRLSRWITIIGTRDADDFTIFTAYGGRLAPREPNDPSIQDDPALLKESQRFWADHALAALPETQKVVVDE